MMNIGAWNLAVEAANQARAQAIASRRSSDSIKSVTVTLREFVENTDAWTAALALLCACGRRIRICSTSTGGDLFLRFDGFVIITKTTDSPDYVTLLEQPALLGEVEALVALSASTGLGSKPDNPMRWILLELESMAKSVLGERP